MKPPQGKVFAPIKHFGGWITLALALIFLAAAVLLAMSLPGRDISGPTFWLGLSALLCLLVGVTLTYRTIAFFRLRYFMNRNGVEIFWGVGIRRVPLPNIIDILPANQADLPARGLFSLTLPDWWAGRWRDVVFLTTAPRDESLAIQTAAEIIVISPQDPAEFLRAWQLRQPLGPTRQWSQEVVRRSIWAYRLWHDKTAMRLLVGGIALCLILIGSVMTAYPAWPASIPVQFNPLGQAVSIASKEKLLWIPAIGAGILLLNAVLGIIWYRKDRILTCLLWFVTILVQVGLWVGVRMIVG